MRLVLLIVYLGLMVWFVIVGAEARILRALQEPSPFRLREFHHAYGAALLIALGWWLHSVTGCFVQLLGIVVAGDDTYQHMRQTFDGRTSYQSPLHQLFAKVLWPKPWVQRLVHALDAWWPLGAVLGLLALWLAT